MSAHTYHDCGGTILDARSDGIAYAYCDRCGAFLYSDDADESFPTGTDAKANRRAWDGGETRSPDAMDNEEVRS